MINIDNVEKYLRDNGISPSYQRKRILEYLYANKNHPNVIQIYENLVKEIPTLSKTTVYNTLNLFVEKKIAEVITVEDNEVRYDLFNPNVHGHFKCENCNEVYDIDIDFNNLAIKDLEGFTIKEQYFNFKGICKKCGDLNKE
ncbi:Fur family transcriptional regulator [Clostridium intestinale]|uniref:Fur family transcriptional regulator n=1 Tax=Clostridium intestinale TaxID=36845 RepID=UPI002DD68B5A|nr:Fur family transcriptional regulator [Clostridium intestinale]WRY50537.1 Fur family transcriptional regulator [Clostridium intestinale]